MVNGTSIRAPSGEAIRPHAEHALHTRRDQPPARCNTGPKFESGGFNQGCYLGSCICETVSVLAVAVLHTTQRATQACFTRADETQYKTRRDATGVEGRARLVRVRLGTLMQHQAKIW